MLGKLIRGWLAREPAGAFWEESAREGPALLSICIPTFQRSAILRRTLEHLAASGGAEWEVVISDNASADDTEAVVKDFRGRFHGLRYARQATNRGPGANSDTCMRLGTGKYLYLDKHGVLTDDYKKASNDIVSLGTDGKEPHGIEMSHIEKASLMSLKCDRRDWR